MKGGGEKLIGRHGFVGSEAVRALSDEEKRPSLSELRGGLRRRRSELEKTEMRGKMKGNEEIVTNSFIFDLLRKESGRLVAEGDQ